MQLRSKNAPAKNIVSYLMDKLKELVEFYVENGYNKKEAVAMAESRLKAEAV